jgi:hypothetical protein
MPALLAGARLGLRVENGNLRYTDKVSRSEYGVKGLELEANNIGLGSPMSLRLTAPLQGKTPALTFSGPVELSAHLEPILEGDLVKSARGDLELDATRLAIHMPGKFEKPDSMPLTAKVRIEGNDKETLLRQLEVAFDQLKLHGKGRVTLSPVNVKLDFNLDPARLDTLKNFVPMLAAYGLKGSLALSTNVDMTPEYFHLNGDLKASDGSFFLKDVLKAPMQFQVQAGFSENSLNLSRASLSAPDSDLQLVGHVKNFLAPQFSFAITGKSFNLDKTIALGEPAKSAGLSLVPRAYAAPPPAEKSPLAPLFANPILAKASGFVNAQIGKVVVEGANLEQVQAKAELKGGNLRLEDAGFRTFGGIVSANGSFDLKSAGLRYATAGSVSGVSGKDAFTNYFPKYKDTLEGNVSANWNVSGALYPATARIRSLQGKAKLVATDGVLKSVDFQDSINSAMRKVPFLKDKKPIQVDDGFKTLTANLSFGGGVIKAEPIDVQPRGKGFVVKGKSAIQENLDQETFFDLYDPQGILPRDIEQPGKPALALRLYGPLTAPKTDYGYTVEKLASNAGKNALKNAAGKALDKFLGGQQGGNKGGDALKDAADKLKKKFKFF